MWVIAILTVGGTAVIISLRDNYYNSTAMVMRYKINSFQLPPSDSSEISRAREMQRLVEDFPEKDKFEFMLMGASGEVIITSSGFDKAQDEKIEDYFLAIESPEKIGEHLTYSSTGEHIMAVTRLFPYPISGKITGIRLVTSLKVIDDKIVESAYLVALTCLIILAFSIFSGIYFVRSIAIPIGNLGNTAQKIADGDYDARIEKKYDDEIGDLCDIINDMAFKLSATERTKNEFISSVSHELRTPLTSIKGWGETIVSSDKSDGTFDKGMKIIIDETDRLSYLVEDLLDFSHMQSGGMTIEKKVIDIVAELSDAVLSIENRAQRKNVEIVYCEPEEMIPVFADTNRLRQVFANILDNAIKYSRCGDKITVTVETDKSTVTIRVADQGLGIPKDDLPKIKEKFFKGSNSLKGSGIGLAISDEIMKQHNGGIEITSKLNFGTEVLVWLPLVNRNINGENE